jgi:hypothetical protein
MNHLYNKNHKTLRKEIEKYTTRWKDLPCSWIDRINLVKMGKKQPIDSMQSPTKSQYNSLQK